MQDVNVNGLKIDLKSLAVGVCVGRDKARRGIAADYIVTVANTETAGPKPKEDNVPSDRKRVCK